MTSELHIVSECFIAASVCHGLWGVRGPLLHLLHFTHMT